MTASELDRQIALLRSRPLAVLARTAMGKEQVMSVQECRESGSMFLHVIADDLDELLAAELGG